MASSFEPLLRTRGQDDGAPAERSLTPWFERARADTAFRPLATFPGAVRTESVAEQPDPYEALMADAVADAEARGRQAALAEIANGGAARAALRLSLQRIDDDLQEALALRIAETVAALCETALAPLTLDRDALHRRCVAAAALLRDGAESSTLRLHPADIALLDTEFAARWPIDPDPQLERGTVHFETADGAVRDGPAEWRATMREALGLC